MNRKQTVVKVDFMERVIPSISTDFYVRDFTFQFCLRYLQLFTEKMDAARSADHKSSNTVANHCHFLF